MKQFLICLTLLLASSYSHAIYRCGNVFQDRPCDGGGVQASPARQAAAAAPGAATTPANTASPFAAACASLGKGALNIIWRRESGVLREDQLAAQPSGLTSQEHADMVEAVYRRRGSASDIRRAIEAECVVEKQRAADAAAILRTLQSAAGAEAPVATPKTLGQTGIQPVNVNDMPAAETSNVAQCASLRAQLASVAESSRRGGNVAAMERLSNERRDIDKRAGAAKC